MSAGSLPQFMAAIRKMESGGNYQAIGPYTGERYGRARGAYQIMETIWDGWAREAGLAGADWRDPRAQDAVASFKMKQYFNRYRDWGLVAAAWFGGPGAANKLRDQGFSSVENTRDVLGTSVPDYVKKVLSLMGEMPSGGAAPEVQAAGGSIDPMDPEAQKSPTRKSLESLWSSMSEVIRSNPDRFAYLYGGDESPLTAEADASAAVTTPEFSAQTRTVM